MFRSFAIPFGSESVVFFDPFPEHVARRQFILRIGIAALRSLFKPLQRFLFICDAKPEMLVEGHAEPKLRFRDAIFRGAPHAALVLKIFALGMGKADGVLSA